MPCHQRHPPCARGPGPKPTPYLSMVWQVPVAGGPLAIQPPDIQIVEAAVMQPSFDLGAKRIAGRLIRLWLTRRTRLRSVPWSASPPRSPPGLGPHPPRPGTARRSPGASRWRPSSPSASRCWPTPRWSPSGPGCSRRPRATALPVSRLRQADDHRRARRLRRLAGGDPGLRGARRLFFRLAIAVTLVLLLPDSTSGTGAAGPGGGHADGDASGHRPHHLQPAGACPVEPLRTGRNGHAGGPHPVRR